MMSPTTIELVKQFEGFYSCAYINPRGYPAIDYGQRKINGKKIKLDSTLTKNISNDG